jgi:hypothetical protein
VESLEQSGIVLVNTYAGMTEQQARKSPQPGKWSLLEILCHLCDEERDDFRQRLRLLLEDPRQDWPAIDPEGWVQARGYASRKLASALADFQKERAGSLAWLKGLVVPDWSQARQHPKLGEIRAGDLLAAWAAHDLLHLRQIVTTQLALLEQKARPFSLRYATP